MVGHAFQDMMSQDIEKFRINEKDIQEIFIRSSGPGGQNVNKVSTAVRLLHVPTGIQVKCQTSRSQHQNRILARELLIKAVEKKKTEAKKKLVADREQERRRTRRKPKALKEKILDCKKKHSAKKVSRQKIYA